MALQSSKTKLKTFSDMNMHMSRSFRYTNYFVASIISYLITNFTRGFQMDIAKILAVFLIGSLIWDAIHNIIGT